MRTSEKVLRQVEFRSDALSLRHVSLTAHRVSRLVMETRKQHQSDRLVSASGCPAHDHGFQKPFFLSVQSHALEFVFQLLGWQLGLAGLLV